MNSHWLHRSLLFFGLVFVFCVPSIVAVADDNSGYGPLQDSEESVRNRILPRSRSFVEAWHRNTIAPGNTPGRYHVDAQPLIENIVDVFNELGIPLQSHRDQRGLRALSIAASIQIGANYPAINFHLSDRCPELAAFYRDRRGFSWAFAWPIESFALRVEGGNASEFGAYAIAGVQWTHPTLPVAIGIGLPVRMKHADGLIGALFQIRAKLN